jgi:hypothetical protein
MPLSCTAAIPAYQVTWLNVKRDSRSAHVTGGLLFPYYQGVVEGLQDEGLLLQDTPVAGACVIVSALLILGSEAA